MNKEFWKNKKVLVTGARGFLGRNLVEKLKASEVKLITTNSDEYNLTKEEQVRDLFEKTKPEIVVHLAANFGNLEYLIKNSGRVLYDNLMMNLLVLEYSMKYSIKKFIGIGTAFSYPEHTEAPFKEEVLLEGKVEDEISPYSIPKRIMLIQSQIYKKQFDLNAIHLILTSLYGPGANLSSAIPSMVKKIDRAIKMKGNYVEFWGTGNVTRDFLYIDDAVCAVILASEKYNGINPINVGSNNEITIKSLTEKIAELMNFRGKIIWDSSKPEGPKRMFLDPSKAKKEFNFEAKTPIEEGLKKTINYFQSLDDLNL